jgi:hypothetical protein
MANKRLGWPMGAEAACDAYVNYVNANWPGSATGGAVIRQVDKFGQPNCGYYGAPFEYPAGVVVTETPNMLAIRATAVLADTWEAWVDPE